MLGFLPPASSIYSVELAKDSKILRLIGLYRMRNKILCVYCVSYTNDVYTFSPVRFNRYQGSNCEDNLNQFIVWRKKTSNSISDSGKGDGNPGNVEVS